MPGAYPKQEAEGTWWAKIRRADKHLQEFIVELARLQSLTVDFEVTHQREIIDGVDLLVVHGFVENVVTNDVATVVGDILANTRDSLDHLMKGLTGGRRVNFPILEVENEERFRKVTVDMVPEARALVLAVQPFKIPEFSTKADPLSVLRQMSNTDKHSTLHLLGTLICDPITALFLDDVKVDEYHNVPSKHMTGGKIANFPYPSKSNFAVSARGGVDFWLTDAERLNLNWAIPSTVESMVKYVRERILEPLDPFTR
jgi:hypothetical protein